MWSVDCRTSRKGDLNKHIASVHERNEPKNEFRCDVCDYRMSRKGDLNI